MYNGHCYGFYDQSLSWSVAREKCQEVGDRYDLVVIDNDEENQFLKDKMKDYETTQYWVGLEENCDRDGLVWTDGSDLFDTAWTSSSSYQVISAISS